MDTLKRARYSHWVMVKRREGWSYVHRLDWVDEQTPSLRDALALANEVYLEEGGRASVMVAQRSNIAPRVSRPILRLWPIS